MLNFTRDWPIGYLTTSGNMPYQQRSFRRDLQNTLANLISKYDPSGVVHTTPQRKLITMPSAPEPGRKPKIMDFDDFSDDEQYYKHRNQVLKYNAWRYSLQNA